MPEGRDWSECNMLVNRQFAGDFMRSFSAKLVPLLEDGIRVLIYAGTRVLVLVWVVMFLFSVRVGVVAVCVVPQTHKTIKIKATATSSATGSATGAGSTRSSGAAPRAGRPPATRRGGCATARTSAT